MVPLGKARAAALVLVICALVGAGSAPAAIAEAGPVEEALSPVVAGVGATVEGVTGAVVPPVQEVTEAATAPLTAAPTRPSPTPAAPVRVSGSVHAPAVKVPATPSVQAPPPAKDAGPTEAAAPATAPVEAAAATVTQAVEGTVGSTAETDPPATAAEDATADQPGAAGGGNAKDARDGLGAGPRSRARDRVAGQAGQAVRAPDGSLIAYVWPAIALTRATVGGMLVRWEQAAVHLALSASGAGGVAGSAGLVVDGVRASGGSPIAGSESAPSSFDRSPFSKIPAAIGNAFTTNAPLSMLAFILVVALGVLVLFAAVGREVGLLRRRRW